MRDENLSRATLTLLLYTSVVVLLYADQNLLAPNLSAAAAEFGFNDKEKDKYLGGDLSLAYFGFGAPASVIVGWLTDFVNRKNLFVLIVVLGELGSFSTAFCDTFQKLFWMRAVTGIAMGGGIPLIYSIMGDLFPSSSRTYAAGAVGLAMGVGQGLGQLVGSIFGHGTPLEWRLPFVVVSIPCLMLSAMVLALTRDPLRGRFEQGLQPHIAGGGEYQEAMGSNALWMLMQTPTVLLVMVQGLPGCVPWGVISVYLNDYLHTQRGYSVGQATLVIILFGVANAGGQVFGSQLGQWLYNKRSAYQPILMGVTTGLGTLPCLGVLHYAGGHVWVDGFFATLGGLLAAVTGPNVKAVLMNVTLPSTRGAAFGVFNLFDDLGRGLGPALAGFLVARMGREDAFTFSFTLWWVCGLLLAAMAFTVERDEWRVQSWLVEYSALHGASEGRGGKERFEDCAWGQVEGGRESPSQGSVRDSGGDVGVRLREGATGHEQLLLDSPNSSAPIATRSGTLGGDRLA